MTRGRTYGVHVLEETRARVAGLGAGTLAPYYGSKRVGV